MALKDARLEISEADFPSPTPVVVGVSTSALDVIENVFRVSDDRGTDAIAPTALGASKPQAAANVIADRIGARAHAATVSSACPSGLDAVALAATMIRSGAAELAIAELLGGWQEQSEADKAVVENLSGKPYGEWIGKIREIALRPSGSRSSRHEAR